MCHDRYDPWIGGKIGFRAAGVVNLWYKADIGHCHAITVAAKPGCRIIQHSFHCSQTKLHEMYLPRIYSDCPARGLGGKVADRQVAYRCNFHRYGIRQGTRARSAGSVGKNPVARVSSMYSRMATDCVSTSPSISSVGTWPCGLRARLPAKRWLPSSRLTEIERSVQLWCHRGTLAAGLVGGILSPVLMTQAMNGLGKHGFFWVMSGIAGVTALMALVVLRPMNR